MQLVTAGLVLGYVPLHIVKPIVDTKPSLYVAAG